MTVRGAMTRRVLLLGGVGLSVAACTAQAPAPAPTTTTTTTTPPTLAPPGKPLVVDVQRQSEARGKTVRVIAMFPGGTVERLPVALALHGRGADAESFVTGLGVPDLLAAAVKDGVAPFAVLAVDGGDTYWNAKDPADDPQKMLHDEVPGWLAEFGLVETPFGAMGISMGAYGALNYGRAMPSPPAIAAISPALFTNWPDARSRNAFADQAQWQRTEPLRHLDDLHGPLGVWCGTKDPFLPVAKQLIAGGRSGAGRISDGGHDSGYWQRELPDVLRFLGGVIR